MKDAVIETEVWEYIEGFEGSYQVSNFGNVRSVSRCVIDSKSKRIFKGKNIKQTLSNKGYLYFSLSLNGKVTKMLTHRAVADAFVSGRSEDNNIVNHLDGNKENNTYSNLEWCSYSHNNTHAYSKGLKKAAENTRKGEFNLNIKGEIIATNLCSGETISMFGVHEINKNGFDHRSVYDCVNGKKKQYKGFTFVRIEK